MAQVTYLIDPAHTGAHFSVRHMMISNVRGEFTKVTGKIAWDAENPANSSIEATIDAASINTREAQRDGHLRSADFLDVENYPMLEFRSTQVQGGDGELKVTGHLTIHGVTRTAVLEVEGPTPETRDPWGNARIGASATTKINRKDFGLAWNSTLETGGVLVGDEVKISIDLEAVRQ
ncbi:MAG TPA: YceI family protein [Terriglobia bacterium]|nr:YceI family protein [Terriglobia bacterium]